MNKSDFFENVKITEHAECNNMLDANGEFHIWVEWGTIEIDGEIHEVKIKYYLDDDQINEELDQIDWDGAFREAIDYDIDGEGALICDYND